MNKYRGKEYWDMVKISNEDKEYPRNMGQIWSNDEEILLLLELNDNIDIKQIAQSHGRTIGGINSRRMQIAYNMYKKKISFEEIIKQTKLDYNSIQQTIQKRENANLKKNKTETETKTENVFISINKNDYIELQKDVKKMKNDINEIKNTLGELLMIFYHNGCNN